MDISKDGKSQKKESTNPKIDKSNLSKKQLAKSQKSMTHPFDGAHR